MSDNKLLLHVLRTVRDTHKEKKCGGEVIRRLKKWYMVGRGFSDKERCDESANSPIEGEAGLLWQNPRRHELLHWLIKELENGH